MSRLITKIACNNLCNHTIWKRDNTEIVKENGISYLKLFGNKIAALTQNNVLWIQTAGWKTNTTRERLNGLPNVSIYQRKNIWYLNNCIWDGRPICVGLI
jgi:hypothetical protein